MYLKVTAINDDLNIKFVDTLGNEVVPYTTLLSKVYNKIGTDYFLVQEDNLSFFKLQTDKITSREEVYLDIYLDDNIYKTKLKISLKNTEFRTKYKLTYTSNSPSRITSNTFLKRISIGMPKWSSAFKNDISIFSKSFYPLYIFAEKIYYKTNQHLLNNLKNIKHNRNVYLNYEPLFLKTTYNGVEKYVGKTYIKEKERINEVDVSLINTLKTNSSISFDNYSNFPIKLSDVFNRVFIRTEQECYVFITGYDNENNVISETLYSDGAVLSLSKLSYSEIISVDADTYNGLIECSTSLSCLDTSSNFRDSFKLAGNVRDNKDIIVPYYKYNEETCSLNVYYSKTMLDIADYEDSYYIPDMKNYREYFISDTDDIVFTNEDKQLCYGILRKDLGTLMPLYPSNNNNTIVSTLNDNVSSDNSVEFIISTQTIMDMYGVYLATIISEIDGQIYYLNDMNEWVEEKVDKLINNITPIYIELDTTSVEYISIVVIVNDIKYQASVLKNKIEIVKTDIIVDSLKHTGNFLIDYKNDNEIFKIDCIKDYYEYINDNTINYVNFKDGKNIELRNIRGYKDGKYNF